MAFLVTNGYTSLREVFSRHKWKTKSDFELIMLIPTIAHHVDVSPNLLTEKSLKVNQKKSPTTATEEE